MDGPSTDPHTDPQVVLRRLIEQAQASTASSHLQPDSESTCSAEPTSDIEDDDTDSSYDSSECSAALDTCLLPPSASTDQGSQLLSSEQISATLSVITADRRELATLSQHKKLLSTARKRNGKYQQSLEKSLRFLSKTREELKSVLHSLDVADVVDAEDQSLEVIRTCKQAEDAAAECPFRVSMVQQVPLLRLQSIERAEYDDMLGSRLWLDFEDAQLRSAVSAVALKAHAIALSLDPSFRGDALAEAAKLDEVSALRLAESMDVDHKPASEPSSSGQGRGANKGLDWPTISARVPTRSLEEVRTRWYGVLRPSVNTTAWDQQEIEDLLRIATPFLAAHFSQSAVRQIQDQVEETEAVTSTSQHPSHSLQSPVPWQKVARQLGTGRTPHACFVAFCSAIVHRDQPDMTSAEDDNIKQLFSLFRGAWRFMALHASASPNLSLSPIIPEYGSKSITKSQDDRPASLLGKVGRDAQLLYRRFRNTTDPALASGSWSIDEDLSLIQAIQQVGDDSWTAVSARIPGRTSTQARERWNRRLKQVVAEAGPAATDEQITELIQGKKKLKWTSAMDAVVLSCLDDEWRTKDGQTFANVASYVSGQIGMQLSDKSVRDRVKVLRGNRDGRLSQRGDAKPDKPMESEQDGETGEDESCRSGAAGQNEQKAISGENRTDKAGASTLAVPGEPDASAQQISSAGSNPQPRARITILPGAKRRKL